jgi:hypothetical protein
MNEMGCFFLNKMHALREQNIYFREILATRFFWYKGCFLKFGVEVGIGESIEIAPLV